MTFRLLALSCATVALTACGQAKTDAPLEPTVISVEASESPQTSLQSILDAQPADVQARYQYRHPKETLEYFGLEPGMTVVEALPGGGWYSKILLPVIGDEGALIGADYALDMWPEFGGFANAEFLEKKKTWAADWVAGVKDWRGDNSAELSAFAFGDRPSEMDGTVDMVLFVRAMHNLARFEDKGGFLTEAIADTYAILKPGGIVGIVQHHAPDNASDEWAGGQNGYLKDTFVIAQMEKAGFEYMGASDINANPEDQPGAEDSVWRLPPSLRTSKDNPELAAKMKSIGESNRMTLKFMKPK